MLDTAENAIRDSLHHPLSPVQEAPTTPPAPGLLDFEITDDVLREELYKSCLETHMEIVRVRHERRLPDEHERARAIGPSAASASPTKGAAGPRDVVLAYHGDRFHIIGSFHSCCH
jgi:hypothetical protein